MPIVASRVVSFCIAVVAASSAASFAECQDSGGQRQAPVLFAVQSHTPPASRAPRNSAGSPALATTLLQTNPPTTVLARLLAQTGLLDSLGQESAVTIFAPSDAAFASLPAGTLEALGKPENAAMLRRILANHVVSGRLSARQVLASTELTSAAGQNLAVNADSGEPAIGGASILRTDLRARNVTVHVIGAVLVPPTDSLIESAGREGRFSTLLTAIRAAGLAETLQGGGPFTLLAPTDEAFAKIGQGKIEELLRPENREVLRAILKYHVIPSRVTATEALTARQAETVEGSKVTFRLKDGRLQVNHAAVTSTDQPAANGIIHTIDTVLMP